MSSLMDKIKAKQKELATKKAGNMRTHKPPAGKQTYRILPGFDPEDRDQIWQDFGMHWIKTEAGGKPVAVHLCEEKTFGEPCDICAAISQASANSQNDDQHELLRQCYASQRYLFNALHINGENKTEPVILEVGITVFEAICLIGAEYGDIHDLENGVTIVIQRDGTGFDTTYHVSTSPKKIKIPESMLGKLHNLKELVSGQRDATKHQSALTNIASIVGLELAEPTPKPKLKSSGATKSIASELDDDDLIEEDDIPFEKGSASDSAASDLDEILDDDDMMEDILNS